MVFRKILSCVTLLAQHVPGIKKKQVENEYADFIYLNDDRKK